MRDKRVVTIADGHSGSRCGLTPPAWWYAEDDPNPDKARFAREQRLLWRWYVERAEFSLSESPTDVLAYLGDAIDGKGHKSGGIEQLVVARDEQCEMALEAIRVWKPRKLVIVIGTKYHTGVEEQWERVLAERAGADLVGMKVRFAVRGCVFDCKHKIGRSTVPYGRHTQAAKAGIWAALRAEADGSTANVILRAHAHYCVDAGAWSPHYRAMVLPCLEYPTTIFGEGDFEDSVDMGLVWWDINKEGTPKWHGEEFDLRQVAQSPARL